jgi:hypothetical protein
MENHLKTLLLVLLTFFITQQNSLAKDPLPLVGDTLVIDIRCDREHLVKPYFLLAHAGDVIEFRATSGAFSIVINNADTFFESAEPTESFLIDTDTGSAPKVSMFYEIKSDLTDFTEIPYTVVCLISGRIIGGINEDAPPKIIIVPRD